MSYQTVTLCWGTLRLWTGRSFTATMASATSPASTERRWCRRAAPAGITLSLHQAHPLSLHQAHPLSRHQAHPLSLHQENPLSLHQANPLSLHQENPLSLHQENPLSLHQANPLSLHQANVSIGNHHYHLFILSITIPLYLLRYIFGLHLLILKCSTWSTWLIWWIVCTHMIIWIPGLYLND